MTEPIDEIKQLVLALQGVERMWAAAIVLTVVGAAALVGTVIVLCV